MDRLIYRPIRVATGSEDEEGMLAILDGRLVAVFVHLQAEYHGKERGCWHHEAGFGACDGRPGVFLSLEDATGWIASRLGIDRAKLGGTMAASTAAP